jgi:hypothetical protein
MDFLVPKLSATMESAKVLRWLKQPGDAIKAGEPLVELETDKAAMEGRVLGRRHARHDRRRRGHRRRDRRQARRDRRGGRRSGAGRQARRRGQGRPAGAEAGGSGRRNPGRAFAGQAGRRHPGAHPRLAACPSPRPRAGCRPRRAGRAERPAASGRPTCSPPPGAPSPQALAAPVAGSRAAPTIPAGSRAGGRRGLVADAGPHRRDRHRQPPDDSRLHPRPVRLDRGPRHGQGRARAGHRAPGRHQADAHRLLPPGASRHAVAQPGDAAAFRRRRRPARQRPRRDRRHRPGGGGGRRHDDPGAARPWRALARRDRHGAARRHPARPLRPAGQGRRRAGGDRPLQPRPAAAPTASRRSSAPASPRYSPSAASTRPWSPAAARRRW